METEAVGVEEEVESEAVNGMAASTSLISAPAYEIVLAPSLKTSKRNYVSRPRSMLVY